MADREAEKLGQTLHQLLHVRYVDWDAVEKRLRSHPHEATERRRRSPLLAALSRRHGLYGDSPPPTIFRALIGAHKDAVVATDGNGWTPLHAACAYHCGAEVVQMLLEAFPEAAKMTDNLGRIPLHFASKQGDAEVVQILLREHPEGVRERLKGSLPLHFAACSKDATPAIVRLLLDEGVCRGVGGGSGGASVKNDKEKTPLDFACERIADLGTSDEFWEKVVALARASTSSTTGARDDSSVDVTPISDRVVLPALHAVVKAGCAERIVRHAISIGNPGAGLMRDHCGRTALGVAAAMSGPYVKVVEILLGGGCSGTEAARMADADGRLPLHLAAESGWSYERGLGNLLAAEPRALATRDMATRLYPFMLAAAEPTSNVDSAFRLLRADPTLVKQEIIRKCGAKRRKIG